MKKLTSLLNAIISIVEDENLPEWELCHLEILKAIDSHGFKPSRLLESDITCSYFNACKITNFKFADFVYNFLELSEQQKRDQEFYIEKNQ